MPQGRRPARSPEEGFVAQGAGLRPAPCPQRNLIRARGAKGPEAPEEGFEPPTRRLTAACSATELLRNGRAIMETRTRQSSSVRRSVTWNAPAGVAWPLTSDVDRVSARAGHAGRVDGQRKRRLPASTRWRGRQLDALQLEHLGRRVPARLDEVHGDVDQQVLRLPRRAAQRERHRHAAADRDARRVRSGRPRSTTAGLAAVAEQPQRGRRRRASPRCAARARPARGVRRRPRPASGRRCAAADRDAACRGR